MAKKMLIADDDPIVSETLKAVLENSGYAVDLAKNGEECLKKVMLNEPDLLLLDIMMPKMDGYSFLVAIQEMKALTGKAPRMPVIVITGTDNEMVRNLVAREKIYNYVLKPFDVVDLLEKIKKATGG